MNRIFALIKNTSNKDPNVLVITRNKDDLISLFELSNLENLVILECDLDELVIKTYYELVESKNKNPT